MDAIGNMVGSILGNELENQHVELEAICSTANYMSLAAENENFPIPQVRDTNQLLIINILAINILISIYWF